MSPPQYRRRHLRLHVVLALAAQTLATAADEQRVTPIRELSVGFIDDLAAALTFVAYATLASDSVLLVSQPVDHHVKVFERDELDVPYVVRYRVPGIPRRQ